MSFMALKRTFILRNGSNLNILGLAAACLVIATQVRGSDVIYGNFDPNNPLQTLSGREASGPQWYGNSNLPSENESASFSTDANTYNVDSVELDLSSDLGHVSDLTVSLYSDTDGTPGSSLGTFSNPANIGGLTFFTATGLALASDTTYWIVATPSTSETSSFTWWNSLASGISGNSEFDFQSNAWGPWSASTVDNDPSLVVYGTPVPEPSTLALFGFGAISFGFLLRRHSTLVVSPVRVAIRVKNRFL